MEFSRSGAKIFRPVRVWVFFIVYLVVLEGSGAEAR